MEDYPKCPICTDIFGNKQSHIKCPKIFKCGDSICKECLEQIIKKTEEDFFFCPVCHKQKVKKEVNIDEYTTNKDLIKVVNTFFNISKEEIKKQEEDKTTKYNIILLGNSFVGKTSIFQRLSRDIFSDNILASVGIDIDTYYFKYKNKKYELKIHDCPGQDKYKALTKNNIRNKDGVLFIYDISND